MTAPRLLLSLCFLLFALVAHGQTTDLSHAVLLVATDQLAGSPYEKTVLLATPLDAGGHVGFIVNRPTPVKMEQLFPEDAPSRAIVDPVYFGGPVLVDAIFAVTRTAPTDASAVIPLMSGLVAVLDSASVDRIIQSTPNDARYFAGLIFWPPGQLDGEIDQGNWSVRAATTDAVLGRDAAALWQRYSGTEI